MIKEFLRQNSEVSLGEEENKEMNQKMKLWGMVEHPDLTLGLSRFVVNRPERNESSSMESETSNSRRKRKHSWDHLESDNSMTQTSNIELQLTDPLPSDWEQCLDLESGRMFYLNRKTLKRSYNWPKGQKIIDLELNISTLSCSDEVSSRNADDHIKKPCKLSDSSCSAMVAVACSKCHMLVMLSKSSPSCPNCKYLNSLPNQQSPPPKPTRTKSLETLCLLN